MGVGPISRVKVPVNASKITVGDPKSNPNPHLFRKTLVHSNRGTQGGRNKLCDRSITVSVAIFAQFAKPH